MKKKDFLKNNFVSIIFSLFILSMSAMYIVLPKEDYSANEKRYLSSMPDFTFSKLLDGSFTKDFETFMADHTPARSLYVGLNAYYNLALGNNGANGIYFSSDGYLIETPIDKDNQLEWNITKISNFAKKIDVPVTMAIAPSKGYIESDRLPLIHREYNDNEHFSLIEDITKDSLTFVNLLDSFEKSDKDLYYKTDHHWNSEGAYLAYTEICKALKVEATPRDAFKIEKYSDFYGTSYSSSGFWFTKPDGLEIWRNKKTNGNMSVRITEGTKTEEYDNLFFSSHLSDNDKYPVYLDGNHPVVTIENNNSSGGNLLIVKDSYAHCLTPFLADNYSKIVMIDLRYYKKSLSQLIASENIDNVLFMYSLDNIAESTDIILD